MTSLCASLPVGAAEESTAPSTEASSEAAGTAAVFDEAEGTCTGLGLGTDGDMIGSEYIIENLNDYIMSRSLGCTALLCASVFIRIRRAGPAGRGRRCLCRIRRAVRC